jgi:hypothetical protein
MATRLDFFYDLIEFGTSARDTVSPAAVSRSLCSIAANSSALVGIAGAG